MHASAAPGSRRLHTGAPPTDADATGKRRSRCAWRAFAAAFTIPVLMVGCGGGSGGSDLPEVRLGYFANVTHAPAIIGVGEGFFAEELGDVPLWTTTFNAGNEAITALFSDALDMTFIGPNPAINGFAQSGGEAIRIVAGSTSGGASFVVAPGIGTIDDLRGRTFATPALANTQDVAFRAWILDNGLMADLEGGGDLSIVPQANAQILETFRSGGIDGAWVPEPWASRLVIEGGGVVFVDERDLWPGGDFVTTHLIVRTRFLEEHPDAVAAIIRALVRAIDFANDEPQAARRIVNAGIAEITGRALSDETLERSWQQMRFTVDPIAESLAESAQDAIRVGLLQPVELDGIYELGLLNEILRDMGRGEVAP